jgi:hypothetical protein
MKILATLTLAPEAPLGTVRAALAGELKSSLYASGVLREVYATEDPKRVVFVIEAEDAAAAKRQLAPLPLVAAGIFTIERRISRDNRSRLAKRTTTTTPSRLEKLLALPIDALKRRNVAAYEPS